MKKIMIFILIMLGVIKAQSWQRTMTVQEPIQLFHSNYALVQPTAETHSKGDFLFEVSHRFIPQISDENKNFLGLDGPANIRFALGYGITDKMMVNLARSNLFDNSEIQLRYQLFAQDHDLFPVLLTGQLGIAHTNENFEPLSSDARRWQVYGQLIANTMVWKKFGVGMVPGYLYNAHIYCEDYQYTFSLGTYCQYYFNDFVSVLAEWTPTVRGWRQEFNSAALALELETGGHFFKFCLTNNVKMNISQYLAGAAYDINDFDEWHLGFFISRTF